MSKIKEIKVIYCDYTCADGCCYEDWWECEIHLTSGEVIVENFLSEYHQTMQVRYVSEREAKIWACIYAKSVLNEFIKCSSTLFVRENDLMEREIEEYDASNEN